jgi:hypothetical protein
LRGHTRSATGVAQERSDPPLVAKDIQWLNLREVQESELHLLNFRKSYFHEVRSESPYEGTLFSPSSPRPLLLSQSSYF